MSTMTSERCPRCGKELQCLAGCSAHPKNWYCEDEADCGYQAWNPNQRAHLAQPAQAVDVERQWREILAIYVAGPMLYTDDGELSDATRAPVIDFLRDSADTVAMKLADRASALSGDKSGPVDGWKLVPRNPTPAMLEASAVEWTRLCHGYAPDSGHYSFMGALWDSMLAASPAPDKEG